MAAPALPKQRIVLTLIYSAGMRGLEVVNLKISDVRSLNPTVRSTSFIATQKMRPKFELADVVNRLGCPLIAKTKLSPLQQKVLVKIAKCRTAALGVHQDMCENSGTVDSGIIRMILVVIK